MRFRSIRSLVTAAALLFVAQAAHAGTSPVYDSWAKQKPGSSVTLKTTTDAAGQKSETHTTYTLVEVTPAKAVIELKSSMVVSGNKIDMPAQKIEIPAGAASAPGTPPPPPPPPPPTTPGSPKTDASRTTETVSVAGKDYKCDVLAANTEASGMKVKSKTWTCPEVPGMTVKMEATTEGQMASKTVMELEKVEVK